MNIGNGESSVVGAFVSLTKLFPFCKFNQTFSVSRTHFRIVLENYHSREPKEKP